MNYYKNKTKKKEKNMVKINQTISDFQEPEEKENYTIVKIEETIQKGFKGLTIEFRPTKETDETKKVQYRVTAWFGKNEVIGSKSKLGAFISAFSDFYEKTNNPDESVALAQDSDNWLNHVIKVLDWREKNREIKVVS
jgi:hypothetical protein